jgi:hypothetical protein
MQRTREHGKCALRSRCAGPKRSPIPRGHRASGAATSDQRRDDRAGVRHMHGGSLIRCIEEDGARQNTGDQHSGCGGPMRG